MMTILNFIPDGAKYELYLILQYLLCTVTVIENANFTYIKLIEKHLKVLFLNKKALLLIYSFGNSINFFLF